MRKIYITILITLFSLFFFMNINAASYMADKTEIVVDLDVSGAESLCQTDDGYVWIGQYSGLTRYDSREFITYKGFDEGDNHYEILNVRALKQKNNKLFVLTYKNLFTYENGVFSYVDIGSDRIINEIKSETNADVNFQLYDLELDSDSDLLYISTTIGLFIYNIETKAISFKNETRGLRVNDVAVDQKRDKYFYHLDNGIYDNNDNLIYEDDAILDIYCYGDILLVGRATGCLRIDLNTDNVSDLQYDFIDDQINRFLYSDRFKTLYVGCENARGNKNAVYAINVDDNTYSSLNNISNNTQLVDIMVDYEGNLWVSSHNVSSSGVSIITKNALTNLLIDDPIWLEYEKDEEINKQVSAVERVGDILYICTYSGVIEYDLNLKKIIPEDGTKNSINAKIEELGISSDIRDVEVFNNKIYFADFSSGLIEYDPATSNIKLYGADFVNDDTKVTITEKEGSSLTSRLSLLNIRCLRAFDGFLAIGYQNGGIIKFDGETYKVFHEGKNVVFINKTNDGKVMFDQTKGLYIVNDDFTAIYEYPTEKNVDGNRLKFLVDDNRVYYTLNSRLFYNETNDTSLNTEIVIPYIKGSIVELNKIETKNEDGSTIYKYVIASQSQIYITDSLSSDNIDSTGKLINYELYDSTNGLKPIAANTSGFYNKSDYKYYFQTTDGIFVYDFSASHENTISTKIAINSIEIDGSKLYGSDINVDKNASRIVFNLSIFGFKPNKGHQIYYKLDGVDNDYVLVDDSSLTISYTNISGGEYHFHVYVVDENLQKSNEVTITLNKEKHFHETIWFYVVIVIAGLLLVGLLNYIFISNRIKKAKKRELELKSITIESIEAIARTIDVKDTYTNGHSIRVGHYSRIIAEELGMEGAELENLYYIALLHDIGKIGIPDAILNKPGRLTDEEFAIMKSHTTKGAKILKDISTIPNIVEGAKYHHEKYGGGGYPEGLKGEEIPYIARIICCADCFDAMATRRVYKDPYPKEKIISEFERCKEIQFDPHMADVVIKLIKEGKLKAE